MLLRQTLLYLPAQLLGPLVQFAAALVWTHWLSPAAYGVLALVMAAQELVFLVCLSWWSHYTMRYLPTFVGDEDRARFGATEQLALAATTLLQSVAVFLVLALMDAEPTGDLVAAALGFTISRSLLHHLSERARSDGRIFAYTVAQTAAPLVGFAIGYAGVRLIAPTPSMALGGFAVAQALTIPLLWLMLGLSRRGAHRPDSAILKAAFRYGLPLLVSGAIGWVSVNGIRTVVDLADGAVAVGLLSVGWGLGQRAISVAAMLVTAAAFPLAVRRMAAGSREASLTQLSRNGALLLGVLAPATVGAIMLTPPIVDLMVGPEFQVMTVAVLPIALLCAAARNLRVHFADSVFLLMEKPGSLVVVNGVEAVATPIFCYLGLRWGGLSGACLGCLAANGIGLVMCTAWACVAFGLRLPWGAVARVGAATASMSLALRFIPLQTSWIDLGVAVIGGGLVYASVGAVLLAPDFLARHAARRAAPA